ncbi:Hypothetical predicted protein [Cloeon dipterum]|uniref:Uncharacterized protein n=1 Tax=Cloeon dipterum TaxID=197152 RepID=A0A8S1CJJ4_9INSE|nr:Hypothetical predicted protein [Cloeon dipterum]
MEIEEKEHTTLMLRGLTELNQKLSVGANDLMKAALYSDLECCERLVAKRHNIKAKTEPHGVNVLHFVALNFEHGVELAHFFISEGLDATALDGDGETPIDYAIRAVNLRVAVEMLKAQNLGYNLIDYCVMRNNLEFAEKVHRHMPGLINEFNFDGRNALHVAAQVADEEMCMWLIVEGGVDARRLCRDKMCTGLHYTSYNTKHGTILADLFISAGCDVNQADKNGWTPLCYALMAENFSVAKVLVDRGAKVNVQINQADLMQVCAVAKKLNSAKYLHSVDSYLIDRAIKFATNNGRTEIRQWLLEQYNNITDHVQKFYCDECPYES